MEENRVEVTEEMTNEMEPVTETYEVSGDTEGGSGKALVVALALAVGAGIATAGKVVYDRLNAKKTGKPKKKRHFHIGWGEERESEVIDLDDEDVENLNYSEEK